MSRVLLALSGVILLAVTALALIWLLGQVMVGLGLFVVGTAGILSRLLWFLVFTGLLAGLIYFVASAWRPAPRRSRRRAVNGRARCLGRLRGGSGRPGKCYAGDRREAVP